MVGMRHVSIFPGRTFLLAKGLGAMAVKKAREQTGVREYRKALASAEESLPPTVVIFGDNEFLRAAAATTLRDAWLRAHPDGDIISLRGSGEARQAGIGDITRELSGGSLFAGDKLVVVRQAERILFPQAGGAAPGEPDSGKGGGREKAFLDRLDDPAPRIWLLLETAQLPRNRTVGKRMAERSFLVPCPNPTPRDVPAFLRARAETLGNPIDDEAADMLARTHGTDLGALQAELDKLAIFAGEGRPIDAGMVAEFMTGSVEFDLLAFTNAVEARDPDQAILYARRITRQGARDQKGKKENGEKSSHRTMAIMAGTVQNLLRARLALALGMNAADFAAKEKLNPWRAGKLMDASRKFTLRELRRMAAHTADQMRFSHDTGGDVAFSLESMAVLFTRPGLLE